MTRFTLATEPVDVATLRDTLKHSGAGGFCSFEGWVRNNNEGREVSGLAYEAYAELAISEGERVVDEAVARYGVLAAHCVHRVGDLRIGDLAVWIGVSAAHRDEAFRACRYIIDEIKHRLPIWKKEHYIEGDTAWVACTHAAHIEADDHPDGHSHESHIHAPSTFTPDYSRQTRLRDVGDTGQAKLAAARVLVIGAGGLGCPVISYLAGAGVGTLGIVDDDVLEASNLHRQVMYDARDIGQRKVGLAARRVAALNPAVKVQTFAEPLRADTIADVFAQFDLVVECTDDLGSRYLANDAAVLTGTPLILASVYQYEGQLQVVSALPGHACLRCLWPEPPSPALAGSCAETGVLGPVPGVLGTLQAMEALKLLLGLPGAGDSSLQLVDLLEGTRQRLPVDVASGCVLHGGCTVVAQRALDAAMVDIDRRFDDLADVVARGFVVVDVRDADEIDASPLPVASLCIPASEIATCPLGPFHGDVLLVCASGKRSHHAARQLRQRGVEAYSLVGGLNALRYSAVCA
ncbi:molybdopterin converting factor [Rhodanobacter sp. Root627]|nr:ThiF family adenylyltransferase [Rhodanobacter sp. Root627]KRA35539.1 molybdopterin converting factor [Rhodanobacter sp. Root627]